MSDQRALSRVADLRPAPLAGFRRILPLVITVISGVVCYGLFYRRGIWLSVIAYGVAPAERVMNGEMPYRDFFFNYTPGILWLNAGLMKRFGISLVTISAGIYLFKLAALVSLFLLARKVTTGSLALIPVCLTLAWLGHRYIFNVHPAQYYLVFAIVAAIVMAGYAERGGWSRLAISGLLVGVVALFKYNVGLWLLLLTAITPITKELISGDGVPLIRRVGKASLGVLIYWSAAGLVLLVLILYMARHEALGPMIGHFIHHASDYAEERAVGLPPLRSALVFGAIAAFLMSAATVLVIKRSGFLSLYIGLVIVATGALLLTSGGFQTVKTSATAAVAYFPPVLFASATLLVLAPLSRDRSSAGRLEWWSRRRELIVVLSFSLAVYLEVFPRADYYHLVRVLPLSFVLFALVTNRLADLTAGRFENRQWKSWIIIPAILLFMIGIKDTWQPQFGDRFQLADSTPLITERASGILVNARDAEFIDRLREIIESNSAADDTIFSFARRASGFYFLAARRNPTRFLWWDSAGIAVSERENVLRMIEEKEFKLVLIQDALSDAEVRDPVETNYHQIARVSDISVFDRNQ